MHFRTEINIPVSPYPISHISKLLSIGSCFSTSIGSRLSEDKFDILVNPFGTIYNPLSIARLVNRTITAPICIESKPVESFGRWVHFDYHSDLSASEEDELNRIILNRHHVTAQHLKETTHLFITLGSAYVFELLSSAEVVCNCHKLPAHLFQRRMLSSDEIMNSLSDMITQLKIYNPDMQIYLTVSPVRHLRDGLINNSRSKAALVYVSHLLADRYDHVHYFPSYECLMDDLRDYRYYEEDMSHPNGMAVKYIYEKIENCFFDDQTRDILRTIRQIKRAIAHRPINPNSQAHKSFVQKTLHTIEDAEKQYLLNFSPEKDFLLSGSG